MKWLKEILVYLRTFAAKMDSDGNEKDGGVGISVNAVGVPGVHGPGEQSEAEALQEDPGARQRQVVVAR